MLMDITMPDMNGIEATRQIKKLLPEVKILMLTMHENDEYVFQALRAGASGYMLKEAADTDLISALRVVQSGQFYLSPVAQSVMVGDYLLRVRTGEEKDSYSSLTEREREILKLVAEGYTNNQIAERLVISPKTVDTHSTHIMDKLNLHSRAELVNTEAARPLRRLKKQAEGDVHGSRCLATPRRPNQSWCRSQSPPQNTHHCRSRRPCQHRR